ncbi:hypothetical protein C2E23DRAFT_855284 [Lenzites betulinus]|nr:hypothetical protein C2E23DRAFT_855284 [Lenzites betulinus]
MPYIVGAVAGVGVIGAAGYGWYHFSGTKRVVDTALEVKQRVQEMRAVAAKKREVAREQAAAMSAAAKEKTASISGRLRARYQASKAAKEGEVRYVLWFVILAETAC